MKLRLLPCLFGLMVLLSQPLSAQYKNRPKPNLMRPDPVSEEQGRGLLEGIRRMNLPTYYALRFQLRYMPHRGDDRWVSGSLWGTWSAQGNALRIFFPQISEGQSLTCFSYSGENPKAYTSENSEPVKMVSLAATGEELIPGMGLTVFDLQMPYLHWTDAVYEGPTRVKGRPAHRFILYPEDSADYGAIGGVRVYIDEDYQVILQAEVLDHSGNLMRTFQVGSLKKIGECWIVKEFNFIDAVNKSKARVMITGASLGNVFDLRFLDVASAAEQVDPLPESAYESTR